MPNSLILPLLPLPGGVLIPGMVVTVALDSDASADAADAAMAGESDLLVVPQLEHRYARVGTIARLETAGDLPDGRRAAILRGLQRAVIGAGVPAPVGVASAGRSGGPLWISAEPVDEAEPGPDALRHAREVRAIVVGIAERRRSRRLAELVNNNAGPGALADAVASWPELEVELRVAVLETLDVGERVDLVLEWARGALAELDLAERIRSDVTEQLDKTQREYLLRQQLDAIRKELADSVGGEEDAVAEYRRRAAEANLPEPAAAAIAKEIERLERSSSASPEAGWVRTWLDTMLEVPWSVRADEHLDLTMARDVLDADHTGLDEVKERIIEHLAVRVLRSRRPTPPDESGARRSGSAGAVLAMVGPPGVGKTSLGESVARALGRPFVRVALGGVRDEAEIRGHRRTYVGALPGRLVRAIAEAGAMNPVMLLDEIDKVGSDWRGDPSSALLEVLDPAQNHTFRDHYLDVDLDLSDVIFLATANVVDTIPAPLLDRMDVVRLDGYTEDEKVVIGRDHLLPRVLESAGLEPGEIALTDDAVRAVVSGYTREAGVRSLERALSRIARKVAVVVGRSPASPAGRISIGADDIAPYLGRRRFSDDELRRATGPGVATGLAVTGVGGEVLAVEAASMAGEGLALTGQLGEVMRESAEIALSYLRAHAEELGIDDRAFAGRRFHLHVPSGAVPKDGPSAGVTMTTALASLLTGRPVRAELGMTGEVTLQGHVLPIGGVKQKVLAAHRAGLTEIVLPARNEPDMDDVPEAVRNALTVRYARDVKEVLALALA